MSTGSDVLDMMSVLDNELDVSASGADLNRAFIAINAAQRYFETLASAAPGVLQSVVTATTTASTETTTRPSTLRRLDAMWALDATTLRPTYRIKKIHEVGGHIPSLPWPLQVSVSPSTGAPSGYYASATKFYWLPLPDGTTTVRIYGFLTQTVMANAAATFPYDDALIMPFASFATKLLAMGVGDADSDLSELADATFQSTLRMLRRFDRSEPVPRSYSHVHDT